VPEWFNAIEATLSDHIRTLRSEDIIFSESARAFYGSGGASMPGTVAPSLRDLKARAALDALLFGPALAGTTVVVSTHDPEDSSPFDRVLSVREGAVSVRLACDGHHPHRHD
jgi:hypothetical protein